MNFKSGQVSVLITAVVSLLAIGSIAAFKILGKRERDDMLRSLSIEAQALGQEAEEIFKIPAQCSDNLHGRPRNGTLNSLWTIEDNAPVEAFVVNKTIGRLKLEKITTELVTEEVDQSSIRINLNFSNFADDQSKKLVGVKYFTKTIDLKVNDCPTEIVKANDEKTLQANCEELPPDGLGGKSLSKVMHQDGLTNPDFLMLRECRVCKSRNRETIDFCL